MITEEVRYWDAVGAEWKRTRPDALWRTHSDAVNCRWLAARLPADRPARLLKTDLFDEAVGAGLHPLLAQRAVRVVGIDVSLTATRAARGSMAGGVIVCADVRRLPFADGAFDVVVSNSTLDHFESLEEVAGSLGELRRVLREGGELLLTLDNLANPVVALRNVLPFGLLHRLHLVPYHVGATCGPRRLRRLVRQAGFEIVEVGAVMHCPRVLAVKMAGLLQRRAGAESQRRFLEWLMKWEQLSGWPSRFLTGYFVVVKAVCRNRPTSEGKP